MTMSTQLPLFTETLPPALPAGAVYQAEFLTPAEEKSLIASLRDLPFAAAKYKGFEARRRVVSFGSTFDYDTNTLSAAHPLAADFFPLRQRVADFLELPPAALSDVLFSEYAPGTPLGWHRDVPQFEVVAGVSLGSAATMRFRPYPPNTHSPLLELELAPRSIYVLRGTSRWQWQHSVAPVKDLRWSITFRTRRRGRA